MRTRAEVCENRSLSVSRSVSGRAASGSAIASAFCHEAKAAEIMGKPSASWQKS